MQMKKQPRNTQVQINEQEVGKLPEKEFRIMTVKMIQNLKSRIEKIQDSINKDLEEIKNIQKQMTQLTEIKNTPEGINSRIPEPERQPSDLEDRMVEITAKEQNKVKGMKIIEDSLRDLWDNIKHTNIQIIGIPEEEKKKEGYEKIFEESLVENFPNMENKIINQVQEMQRVPYRIKGETRQDTY